MTQTRPEYGWGNAREHFHHACVLPPASAFVPRYAKRILDLGCGNGHLASALKGCQVIGVDASVKGIRHARSAFPPETSLVGDVCEPIADGKFDCLISAEIFSST